MVNLDSLKLQFHRDLAVVDYANYRKKNEEIDNDIDTNGISPTITSYKLRNKHKRTGLKEIEVKENYCSIDFSSKLIPELYQQMITVDTIEQFLTELNNTGLICFNVPDIINNSTVRTCDITNNMIVDNVATYVNATAVFKINDKYNFKYWQNESVQFERKVKTASFREHLTIYNKLPELLTAKNKAFRTGIDLNYFKNVLRIESKFMNHELIRKSFEIPDNNLMNILNSSAKVNYKLFCRLTDIKNTDIQKFNNYKTLTEMKQKIPYSKIRNVQGDLSILDACNNDIDLVKLFFMINSTANNSKYIRHMKELLKAKHEIESKNNIDDKVIEMKQFLKNA